MLDWTTYVPPVLAAAAVAACSVTVRRFRIREEQAHQAAQDARDLKNDFVAMVSHELRTPLTSIAGFAETLNDSWQSLPPGEVEEFLAIISRQAQYLSELVEDVLVIPRLEAGRLRLNPEIVDLSALVHLVAGMHFPPGSRREAQVSIPGGVRVFADPRRVQQVVRNLLENARKYGGEQVLVEGFSYGSHYVVVVSDNGPGVVDEAATRIFEHFEQISKGDARSATGIGLGLPIARKLARAMGGDVWYERRFPTGSRFCFSIATNQPGSETPFLPTQAASATEEPAEGLRVVGHGL
ncbi:MAG: sensor histidine kinase [Acidimicrobiia bacterium]